MGDIESLQLELDSLLCTASLEKLVELMLYLEIEETSEGKSKFQIVKIIRNTVEKTLSEPGNIDLDEHLHDVIAFLHDTPPPLEKTPDEQAIVNLERQLSELKTVHKQQLGEILQTLEEKKQSVGLAKTTNSVNTIKVVDKPLSQTPILRYEFKISGQIGEPGQLDKLTYVSLIHQIDSGIEKGYSEREITDAVIKAISPHSSLRNYVLTLPTRSLAKLRSILRVFFQEKTAADLYQALVTTSQKPRETPQQFLLRALDARNKVFFASHEEKSVDEYSKQLVQNTFLKTVETGLRDETLTTNLRPLLKQSGITDEELMQSINELATTQAERKAKGNLSSERQRIAAAHAAVADTDGDTEKALKAHKIQRQIDDNSKQLQAEVKQLKSELESLKRGLLENNQYQPQPAYNSNVLGPRFQSYRGRGRGQRQFQSRYQQYGCRACKERGSGSTCQHCFRCGEVGHVRSECRQLVQQQGNASWLLQGGAE